MLLTCSVVVMATNGPFETLEEAAVGKNILRNPEFVSGAPDYWGNESPEMLFDFNTATKYGSGTMPYEAIWKYDQAYIVDRIILAAANDNESNPRRMGDGWTFSGSNDGSTWTVIYTGKEDDVQNLNIQFFYVDLPNNTTAYQYYRLFSDFGATDQSKTQHSYPN